MKRGIRWPNLGPIQDGMHPHAPSEVLVSTTLGSACGHVSGLPTTRFLPPTILCVPYMILVLVHQTEASINMKNDEQHVVVPLSVLITELSNKPKLGRNT